MSTGKKLVASSNATHLFGPGGHRFGRLGGNSFGTAKALEDTGHPVRVAAPSFTVLTGCLPHIRHRPFETCCSRSHVCNLEPTKQLQRMINYQHRCGRRSQG